MINGMTLAEAESWIAQVAGNVVGMVAEIEKMATFFEINITPEAMQSGQLVIGYDDRKQVVLWSELDYQRAHAAIQLLAALPRAMRAEREAPRTLLEDFQSFARPVAVGR